MKQGFTLVELLLSVALIAILMGIMLPVFYGFRTRHDLDIAAESVASSLRRASVLARGVESDMDWGVVIATGTITIFRGSSFAARAAADDESIAVPDTFRLDGLQEVVFERVTGFPRSTGTTTITAISGEARTVGINARGMVSF
jgi:prepilin-type N-terminal cleavage/methylation domain-containing protein